MASSSSSSSSSSVAVADLSKRENPPSAMTKKRAMPFKFMVPLFYAPLLPLIRITLRQNPVLRDRLFYGVLAGAFAHGSYIVTDLYDAESK